MRRGACLALLPLGDAALSLCGRGTRWESFACVADAPPPAQRAVLSAAPARGMPLEYVERRRFERADGTTTRVFEATVDADYRVDDALGCGWEVRERVPLPHCHNAPVLADCWEWRVLWTTNGGYDETSVCNGDDVGDLLLDVETGASTGVRLTVPTSV